MKLQARAKHARALQTSNQAPRKVLKGSISTGEQDLPLTLAGAQRNSDLIPILHVARRPEMSEGVKSRSQMRLGPKTSHLIAAINLGFF